MILLFDNSLIHRLDRLVHHGIVVQIEGASYRFREHSDLIQDLENDSIKPQTSPKQRRGKTPRKMSENPVKQNKGLWNRRL